MSFYMFFVIFFWDKLLHLFMFCAVYILYNIIPKIRIQNPSVCYKSRLATIRTFWAPICRYAGASLGNGWVERNHFNWVTHCHAGLAKFWRISHSHTVYNITLRYLTLPASPSSTHLASACHTASSQLESIHPLIDSHFSKSISVENVTGNKQL